MNLDSAWLASLQGFTELADQAVILPVVVLTGLFLVLTGRRRDALVWAATVSTTLATVLAAKLFVAACEARLPAAWALHSPSGHTASAALVCGSVAVLLPWRYPRRAALLCALLAAILFGTSRVLLEVHTVADVLAGAAIGILGAGTLGLFTSAKPFRPVSARSLEAMLAVAAILLHGRHLNAEERIRNSAVQIWPLNRCVK